jgi:hypothetical protein
MARTRLLCTPPHCGCTDVALEVVAEVERRNRDRPAGEHILLQQTPAGQVRLHTLERMVQRQAQRIDAGERIAAQRGRAASRAHWDPNVGELRVDSKSNWSRGPSNV